MRKVLYTLLLAILAISVYGCGNNESEDVETTEVVPFETPVEEIEAEVEETVETAKEEVEEVEEAPNEEIEAYKVVPGPTNDEDIEVGKGLVIEIFKLMYDYGDANEIDSESVERLKTLYDTPESIEVIIESGEYTLNSFETITVEKVTPSFIQHYVSTTGNQAIEYDTVVEFILDGEAVPKIFKTTIAKRENKLKLAGFE